MSAASYEMQVFVQVDRLGSFSAAAMEFGLTPSAVSKVISRLEDRLGVKLISRTTRKLSLTSEGEIYLEKSKQILAAIAEAEIEVSKSGQSPSGILRINTGPTFARYRLMSVLPEFIERYPEIQLSLDITDRQIDLATERVDVAVRTGPLVDSRLVARKFMSASRIICASPNYLTRNGTPVLPTDLEHHQCLLISGLSGLNHWPFLTSSGHLDLRIDPTSMSDNADIVRDMACAGLGIARLIRYTVEPELAGGILQEVLADMHRVQSIPVSAVILPERQKVPRVRAFIDFMVEKFS